MSVAAGSGGGEFGSGPIARPAGRPFTPTVGVGEGPSGLGGPAGAGATAIFVMAVSAVALLQGAEAQRVMLTACLSMILFSLVNFAPPIGVGASLVYLAFVGGLKRALIPILGYSALDPLLMVIPVVVLMSFMNRIIQRQVPRDTHLDKVILAFVCFMAIQILNPLQGGLAVGMAGALFYIVPVLWFYIGRRAANERTLKGMFTTFVIVAFAGACYGLYQTWFGFSDVEKQWLALTHNDSGLHLNAATRVFSFFSSFSEYCQILIIAFLTCVAAVIKKNRAPALIAVFLFVCIVLSSSRGAVLSALSSIVVMWAVQGKTTKTWVPRLVLAAILVVITTVVGIGQVANNTKFDAVTADLIQHQAKGLANPFDEKKSTGANHVSQIWEGVATGFRNPLGNGLGSTTLAAGKFSSGTTGTESDFGNMFVSLGMFGGGLYVYLVYYITRKALLVWKTTRSFVSLVVLGILTAEFGAWLASGHYSTTMLVWFCAGWLGRYEMFEKIKSDATKPPRFLRRGRRFSVPASSTTPPSPVPSAAPAGASAVAAA